MTRSWDETAEAASMRYSYRQRAVADAAVRFRDFAYDHGIPTRTLTAIRNALSWRYDDEDLVGDWVEYLRRTPDEVLLGWRNFGDKSLADVRRLIAYEPPSALLHPWWLLGSGYQP